MKTFRFTFILIFIFSLNTLRAQDNTYKEISDSISIKELTEHIYYLASDSMKGRMAGSEEYFKAANYAAEEFKNAGLKPILKDSLGNLTFFQEVKAYFYDPSPNVVAYIEGSDSILKHQFIGIGAHLDHVGVYKNEVRNGADDNASGSTAVIEIAEAVAFSKPKRSVIFILFAAEEVGLYGSRKFVSDPPIELDSLQLFVNLDMIGRSDGEVNGIAPIGFNKGKVPLKDLLIKVNESSVNMELDFDYAASTIYFAGSDHYWFFSKGVPVIFFFNGLHPDYHKPGDDPEKIDFKFMQKVSKLSYELIMETANSDKGVRSIESVNE